ncbi:MAG: SpoIVB peptidase S55 [Veillonellaceae bacterium]|nr:SpoIVB peptidase S55 [Veillonellaceae bacterium]
MRFKQMLRRWLYGLPTLFCALCVGYSAAAVDFLTTEEVQEGMHGIAKTVIHGSTIENFDVEVLGVLKQRGPSGDLVLVRVSGDVIDKTGGIAQGMSGSPVYIDGKLLGAIGYGWGFADGRIGMVTPIQDMLKLWALPDEGKREREEVIPEGAVPLATPLMASGYTPEALDYLTKKLAPYNLVPHATGAAGSYDATPQPLEPGSAVAVTLVTGDVKLGAVGTVTYVDEGRVLAFGHPFLKRGKLDYFMHNSYIFTVVPSLQSAFKIGSIGSEVGKINQDRGAGIAGIRNVAPTVIPFAVQVTDEDTGASRNAHVRMIDDEELTPILAATTAYDLARKTLDRGGSGTVKLAYTLLPRDPSQKPFHRTNMYYSSRSVSERAVDELYNVLDALVTNQFAPYRLRSVEMTMQIEKDKRVAEILDARATPSVVSPGDAIYIRVRLRPYRDEVIYRDLVFRVPKDQPLGPMNLEVRGGGVIPLPYLIQKQQLNLTDEIIARLRTYKDFEDFRSKLESEDRNNEIIVEILEDGVSMVPDEEGGGRHAKLHEAERDDLPGYLKDRPGTKPATEGEDKKEAKARLETEYIIKGDGQFSLDVVTPAEKERRLRGSQRMPDIVAEMHKDDAAESEETDNEKDPTADPDPSYAPALKKAAYM